MLSVSKILLSTIYILKISDTLSDFFKKITMFKFMLHLKKYIKVFFTKEDSDEEIVNWIRDNIISKRKKIQRKVFLRW